MRDDSYDNQVAEPARALLNGGASAGYVSTAALPRESGAAPDRAPNTSSAERPADAAEAQAPEMAPATEAFPQIAASPLPENQPEDEQPEAPTGAMPLGVTSAPTSAPALASAGEATPDARSLDAPNEAVPPAPLLNLPAFRPLWTVTPSQALPASRGLADEAGVIVSSFAGPTPGWKHWLREGLSIGRDVLLALVVALLIGLFVIQPVYVKGTSMLPRLREGERLFVNRFIYNFSKIERGDIVVFYYPKNPQESFIKRVIGLPGDEVLLSGGKLYINGKLIPETYLSSDYTTIVSPPRTWVVEPHHYFVMGDNRDASNDSRNWGLVPEMYIYGKAVYRYWPLSEMGFIEDEAAALEPLRSSRRMEPQQGLPPAE
ncbi:MAG: signal peptidase I [Chloracidobacterium sp. CP2_5A]|nr:MAG: signal peptidase I [Chloracidobacterium sp. CP2_5A]